MVRSAPLEIIPVGMYPIGFETPAGVRNRVGDNLPFLLLNNEELVVFQRSGIELSESTS